MRSVQEQADIAHARYAAARAELLRAVADLEAEGSWGRDGAASFASWLAGRWQISGATARELVRDARALRARPALDAALGAGEISVDQCQALTTLSEEGTDDDAVWMEVLGSWSLPELHREARKRVAKELEHRDGGEYLRMRHTPDERFVRGEFQLRPEDGAAVMAAVEDRIPRGTPLREWDAASARALVELATGSEAPRATVLVSVSEEALASGSDADQVAAVGRDGLVGGRRGRTVQHQLGSDRSLSLPRDRDPVAVVMSNRHSGLVESRMRGNVHVRFGGAGRGRTSRGSVPTGGPTSRASGSRSTPAERRSGPHG